MPSNHTFQDRELSMLVTALNALIYDIVWATDDERKLLGRIQKKLIQNAYDANRKAPRGSK